MQPHPRTNRKIKKAVIASDIERNALIILANKAHIGKYSTRPLKNFGISEKGPPRSNNPKGAKKFGWGRLKPPRNPSSPKKGLGVLEKGYLGVFKLGGKALI